MLLGGVPTSPTQLPPLRRCRPPLGSCLSDTLEEVVFIAPPARSRRDPTPPRPPKCGASGQQHVVDEARLAQLDGDGRHDRAGAAELLELAPVVGRGQRDVLERHARLRRDHGGGARTERRRGALARLVRGVQRRDNVGRVEAGILCERARHHLQREAVLVDRVLVEAGLRLGVLLQQVGELKLAPARAGDKARVARHRLDGVDAVVDGALDVVHDVG
mmetsp:Transcript_24474/g.77588  ORF Transcript_24474/g.77588 Transcript_24474/m.77588 type:complete len:218 (-) Transcript_24474:340-993(-)